MHAHLNLVSLTSIYRYNLLNLIPKMSSVQNALVCYLTNYVHRLTLFGQE